jgi:alpha-amylase
MNILSDFKIRLNAIVPKSIEDQEIANLKELVNEKSRMLDLTQKELKKIKKEITATKLTQSKAAITPKVEPLKQTPKEEPKKQISKLKK